MTHDTWHLITTSIPQFRGIQRSSQVHGQPDGQELHCGGWADGAGTEPTSSNSGGVLHQNRVYTAKPNELCLFLPTVLGGVTMGLQMDFLSFFFFFSSTPLTFESKDYLCGTVGVVVGLYYRPWALRGVCALVSTVLSKFLLFLLLITSTHWHNTCLSRVLSGQKRPLLP